jgi:predicted nucleic acid-binding protein
VFLADSSAWIDVLRGRFSREAALLRQAVKADDQVCLCGPVMQEVLQGIQDETECREQRRNLMQYRLFETTRWTFDRAAWLYRLLRRKGLTVNSYDTVIAAVCLEQGVPLLTCDRKDFGPLSRHAGLKLL